MTSDHESCGPAVSPARATIAGLALAATLLPATVRADEWSGSATLYGWLTWMEIEGTPDDGTGSIDQSLSLGDVVDALRFAFFGAADIHYGRIGIMQDVVYSDLGFDGRLKGPFASKVDVDNEMLLSTTVLGYQVYAENGALIEPFAGARYVSTKMDLKIKGGGPLGNKVNGFVNIDWWDPVIGVRGRMPLTEKVSAVGFADIGGFGAGSQFSWEIYGALDYAITENVSTNVGFRYLSIEYDASDADVQLDTYGPILGLTVRF